MKGRLAPISPLDPHGAGGVDVIHEARHEVLACSRSIGAGEAEVAAVLLELAL
jgi:hypothetical protein